MADRGGGVAVLRRGTDAGRVGKNAGGLIFVGGFAAYGASRQVLFPLRAIPRATKDGLRVFLCAACGGTAATAALLLP
jgi:phosphatidylglycerol---prolipoprotein diacylglyceryl transferase